MFAFFGASNQSGVNPVAVVQQIGLCAAIWWQDRPAAENMAALAGGGTILAFAGPTQLLPGYMLIRQGDTYLVAIQGTGPAGQWVANILGTPGYAVDHQAHVHTYFGLCGSQIMAALAPLLPSPLVPGRDVIQIAGHSLGAAVGYYMALQYTDTLGADGVSFMGFAGPKTYCFGVRGVAPTYQFDIWLVDDPVPYVPQYASYLIFVPDSLTWLFSDSYTYTHYARSYELSGDGTLAEVSNQSRQSYPSVAQWQGIYDTHLVEHYVRAIRAMQQRDPSLRYLNTWINELANFTGGTVVPTLPNTPNAGIINLPDLNRGSFNSPPTTPVTPSNLSAMVQVSMSVVPLVFAPAYSSGGISMPVKCEMIFTQPQGPRPTGWSEAHYQTGVTSLTVAMGYLKILARYRSKLLGGGILLSGLRTSQVNDLLVPNPDTVGDSQVDVIDPPTNVTLNNAWTSDGVVGTLGTTLYNSDLYQPNLASFDSASVIGDVAGVAYKVRLEAGAPFKNRATMSILGNPDYIDLSTLPTPANNSWNTALTAYIKVLTGEAPGRTQAPVTPAWSMQSISTAQTQVRIASIANSGTVPPITTFTTAGGHGLTPGTNGQIVHFNRLRIISATTGGKFKIPNNLVVASVADATHFTLIQGLSQWDPAWITTGIVVRPGLVRRLSYIYPVYAKAVGRWFGTKKVGPPSALPTGKQKGR